ncbi:MAG TPA: indolepyruvate ferredoxin oxidoreductase subunit alpha, partial [Rhodopila sp.]|nr:indolepyruvate ferredoxin oxidoreductase subunit alpha [Rhodopila sp.]
SIMQERSHAFAMKSQLWLLDPRPNLPSIVRMVEHGFALSEASNTPVMLEVRIRACHVHGSFIAKDNRAPPFSLTQARNTPRRDTGRIVLPPASFAHERDKIARRWPAAVDYIQAHGLNEFFGGDLSDVGIILQGGMYNGVMRALMRMGLADIWGATRVPLYVLNVTYPLVDAEVVRFCSGKQAVLLVEEGQPDFIEQALSRTLREAGVPARLLGKHVLPMAGEYTVAVLEEGVRGFMSAAGLAGELTPPANAAAVLDDVPVRALAAVVPARPPGFCTGCPERPIFSAMKLVEQELGQHHIAADIGCHLFSILPPFNVGTTTMGYGLGPASASALNGGDGRRVISIMGDGGFWHNGLNSSIGNAVYNKSDNVTVIVDNHYSAATGGQDLLSSRAGSRRRSTGHAIGQAVWGVGGRWVRQIDRTYDVARMRDTLREALTTVTRGPKVIVASSECMLNRQRREKPLMQAAIKAGKRVVRPRFGVDQDVCTGDHACMRLSGCPSLSLKHTGEKLRDDPVAVVDNSCVGCGHCGEVANAAVLCPSFYRADIVENPSRMDRFLARVRGAVIGTLQRRRAARHWMPA